GSIKSRLAKICLNNWASNVSGKSQLLLGPCPRLTELLNLLSVSKFLLHFVGVLSDYTPIVLMDLPEHHVRNPTGSTVPRPELGKQAQLTPALCYPHAGQWAPCAVR